MSVQELVNSFNKTTHTLNTLNKYVDLVSHISLLEKKYPNSKENYKNSKNEWEKRIIDELSKLDANKLSPAEKSTIVNSLSSLVLRYTISDKVKKAFNAKIIEFSIQNTLNSLKPLKNLK